MNKLLTIAIPSYNRSSILQGALSAIIPQIQQYSDDIELVLSDDGSTDNTFEIMCSVRDENDKLDIVINKQPNNTGFYGNFRKCREMSSGKYLWILSDNEYLLPDTISYIIPTIKDGNSDLIVLNNKPSFYLGKVKEESLNIDDLMRSDWAYKITLTSNAIFINNKLSDEYIFDKYVGNIFFGLILLLSGIRPDSSVTKITGVLYNSIPCKPWVGFAMAFTGHINKALAFGMLNNSISFSQRNKIVDSIIKNVIYERMLFSINSFRNINIDFYLFREFYFDRPIFARIIEPLYESGAIKIKILRMLFRINRIAIHKKIIKKILNYANRRSHARPD